MEAEFGSVRSTTLANLKHKTCSSNFHIDFDEVLDMLEDRLTMIPGKPEIQQFNPRPYKLDKKTGENIKKRLN